jgi:hypothetical protein
MRHPPLQRAQPGLGRGPLRGPVGGILVAIVLASAAGFAPFLPTVPAAAQTILVQVTATESGSPVQGAFVTLVDSAGSRLRSTLTNPDGQGLFVGLSLGRYRLRVEMVGRETATSATVELAEAQQLRVPVSLAWRPFELSEITVEAERQCRVRPEEGERTAALWEEARKALEVAAWAQEEEVFRYSLMRRVRELDPQGNRVRSERVEVLSGWFREPFRSRSPADLVERGFVQEVDGDTLAFAPDARVLLSDAFLDTHCFALRKGRPEGTVGLAFEPVSGRPVPDIGGVVWLDQASGEIRSTDFRYTRFPGEDRTDLLGGRVEFQRLPTGAWIVRRWHIRMPVRGMVRERVTSGFRVGLELVALQEEGGEVRRVTDATGRVLSSANGATLAGTIFDSLRAEPLAGARVYLEGTPYETRTDSAGGFRIEDLPEGRYQATFTHPHLDSLRAVHPPRPVDLAEGRESSVFLALTPSMVPTARPSIPGGGVAARPGGAGTEASGRIVGQVLEPTTGEAVADAAVRLPELGLAQISDAEGRFVFPAVPAGSYQLRVELLGRATLEDSVLVQKAQSVVLEIRLPVEPIPVPGVVVEVERRSAGLEDSGFYHRRATGRGIYISRKEIAERQPITTVDLFESRPGIRVIGQGIRRAVLLTGSRTVSVSPKPCWPAVWLNGQMLLPGGEDDPSFLDDLVGPDEIDGLEIYTSPARIPVQYNIAGACGVIVIWTRQGG